MAAKNRFVFAFALLGLFSSAAAQTIDPVQLRSAIGRLETGNIEQRVKAVEFLLADPSSTDATSAIIRSLTTDRRLDLHLGAKLLFSRPRQTRVDVVELMKGLSDDDRIVRAATAYQLMRIGQPAEFAIPKLRETLSDRDKHPRNLAAIALSAIGPEAAEAVVALIAALEDEGTNSMSFKYVRASAALALGSIGPDAHAAVDPLVRTLADRINSHHPRHLSNCSEARAAAAYALGRINVKKVNVITALTSALKDNDRLLRYHAVVALGAIDPSAQTQATLSEMVDDDDKDVRRAVSAASLSVETSAALSVADIVKKCTDARARQPESVALWCRFGPRGHSAVRDSIALALAYLASSERGSLSALKRLAEGSEEAAKQRYRYTVQAIGKVNRDFVPVVLMAMKQSSG